MIIASSEKLKLKCPQGFRSLLLGKRFLGTWSAFQKRRSGWGVIVTKRKPINSLEIQISKASSAALGRGLGKSPNWLSRYSYR